MNEAKIIFCERKETGVSNIPAIQNACMEFPIGQRLQVTIQAKNRRSNPQNNYIHLTFDLLASELNKMGNNFRPSEIKELLKFKYLLVDVVNSDTGECLGQRVRGTSELTKEEFSEFVEKVIQFASELNIRLPLPNENIEMNF